MREPFIVAYARWESMPAVLLELETDTGLIGWGEAVPDEVVTGEHYRSTTQILTHVLIPAVLGRTATDIDGVHRRMAASIRGNPAAKAAVDIAMHDLLGQAATMPLYGVLGGAYPRHLSYPRVLSVGEPALMAKAAEAAIGHGYDQVKIKVGADDVRVDLERIRAVCEVVAGRAEVRVDVNQHWHSPAIAVPAIRSLEGLDLRWVEQPVQMADVRGLAEVRSSTSVPVMADESVHGMSSLLTLIEAGAADAVNIKLMKAGGIQPALAMIATAEAAGIQAQIGSMVESSVGSAAGYHVAAARGHVQSTELTGPLLFGRDVADDLVYRPPTVHLRDAPGLGVRVDRDVVEELRVAAAVEVR